MSHKIFTCWATADYDPSAPWMIWACDEYQYEGDPDTADADLVRAKNNLSTGFEFREVTVLVSYAAVVERFDAGELEGTLATVDAPTDQPAP